MQIYVWSAQVVYPFLVIRFMQIYVWSAQVVYPYLVIRLIFEFRNFFKAPSEKFEIFRRLIISKCFKFSQNSGRVILQFFGKVPINYRFFRDFLIYLLLYYSHFRICFNIFLKLFQNFPKIFQNFIKFQRDFSAVSL